MARQKKTLRETYPNIAYWVEEGSILINSDYQMGIVAKAYNADGIIWEGNGFESIDEAMVSMDNGIGEWIDEDDDD